MLPVLGFDIRSDPDMRSCAFFVRFAVIVFVLMIYTHIHVGRCASVVLLGDDWYLLFTFLYALLRKYKQQTSK